MMQVNLVMIIPCSSFFFSGPLGEIPLKFQIPPLQMDKFSL